MKGILDQYGPLVGLIGLCLSVCLSVAVVMLGIRLRAATRRWADLMKGASGSSIESLLRDHLDRTVSTEERLTRCDSRLQNLETKMETSKRYVGVVRYDAFEDVGGSQSFALAVYDENGDGAVITSMVGRAECRVYAKEIKQGRADRDLSKEEQAAIQAAAKGREQAASAVEGAR
jgi:hypothetical protein